MSERITPEEFRRMNDESPEQIQAREAYVARERAFGAAINALVRGVLGGVGPSEVPTSPNPSGTEADSDQK